jgi:tRNA pseudouridine32 synthase / 23S rRNA pseudouridine746 synthase
VILHLDAQLVVADKPAGLPSVPGRPAELHDCLWHRVRDIVPDALVVHRLDMATSGLMLFARGIEVQRSLSRAFAERRLDKRYVAVVAGQMPAARGEIDLPLVADWPNRPRQCVDAERGKPSLTLYRVLSEDKTSETTRVELEPRTGRSHQLRVHLQAIGHPILGDELYADEPWSSRTARLMLHASALGFEHPGTQGRVEFHSPPPF